MIRAIIAVFSIAASLSVGATAAAADVDIVRSACNALGGSRKTDCLSALGRLLPNSLPANAKTANNPDSAQIESARAKITAMLNDPESVRFRAVDISPSTKAVCGTLNAKNAMGGYGEPKRFLVTNEMARIESAVDTWKFDYRWVESCPEF